MPDRRSQQLVSQVIRSIFSVVAYSGNVVFQVREMKCRYQAA
jgi:hypothetical protein